MSENSRSFNQIPLKTWRWLDVNAATIKEEFPQVTPYQKQSLSAAPAKGVTVSAKIKTWQAPEPFSDSNISPDLLALAAASNSGWRIEIAPGEKIAEPLIFTYQLDKQNSAVIDDIVIHAGQGSEATVIIHYAAETEVAGFHGGLTRLSAEKDAKLTLIKLQTLPDTVLHIDAVLASAGENAETNVILAELGASRSISGCDIRLLGEASTGEIHSIYLGDKNRKLDMNYVVSHQARASVSNIVARGALLDQSEKIFRDTLDFCQGAAGSKGREEEYTVLLSPNIRNRSVPLMLSGEHDVDGQHAASAGKLDENKLFYLMSRGFSETEAKKMIVEASFQPILEKIPVEYLKQIVSAYIKERLNHVR